MNQHLLRVLYCFSLTAVLLFTGCWGGGNEVELGAVSGVVTMDGEPLADAMVIFVPEQDGNPSSGRTDSNGKYELKYLSDARGALVGKHKVSIITADPLKTDESDPMAAEAVEFPRPFGDSSQLPTKPEKIKKEEPIPAKYNSATELTAEVSSSGNTINFDLTSQ